MNLLFHKYQGTGNDFIVGDNRNGAWDKLDSLQRHKLCHRKFGIGADGILLLASPAENSEALFVMQYFNADGKTGSFCGNGSRCLLAFASSFLEINIGSMVVFEAFDGLHEGRINTDGSISVRMKKKSEIIKHEKGFLIDTGSPHLVIEVNNVHETNVPSLGKALRYDPSFEPEGLNVNFYQTQADGSLFVRTYERGVEDETLSCGTGVTAVALVHRHRQQVSEAEVRIQTPGGWLTVDLSIDNLKAGGPILSGPAVCVFTGNIFL